MRVVSPYRPFPAESEEHKALGVFDWVGALEMLRESVRLACRCETYGLTDVDTTLPGPTFTYRTTERRLMLWILEVSLCYLQSPDFDCDTVMCSPDQLVYQDLRPWFAGDFGIVVRRHALRPILNALQWWPVASKSKLCALYERALWVAHKLPEDQIAWGADSVPFVKILRPIRAGLNLRLEKRQNETLAVNMVDSREVMTPLTSEMIAAMEAGEPVNTRTAVVDFRFLRKKYQRQFFDATIAKVLT